MTIAGCQLTPGITDTNDRLTPEFLIWYALIFHPGSVNESVFPLSAKPALTPEICIFHNDMLISQFMKMSLENSKSA
jgi:hypothetical protein